MKNAAQAETIRRPRAVKPRPSVSNRLMVLEAAVFGLSHEKGEGGALRRLSNVEQGLREVKGEILGCREDVMHAKAEILDAVRQLVREKA